MLSNIFSKSKGVQRIVHCEMNGKATSIEKTRILTKANVIINLKRFKNPRIDFEAKTIFSSNKDPIKFLCELHIPPELKPVLGDLYATVEDEDELEQSTHILSDEGINIFMAQQFFILLRNNFTEYLKEYETVTLPDALFFVSANEISSFKSQSMICDNWGISYPSVGKKYMIKKILETKTDTLTFGRMSVLCPGYDVAFSDCSAKNPTGTGYQFITDKNFIPTNLCSNESAVDYCIKNNCLAYYTDFVNGGKMRVLSKYTESVNKNLRNDYKFRSSNI